MNTAEVATPSLFNYQVHEINDLEVAATGEVQTMCESVENTQDSASLQSLPGPPSERSLVATQPSPLICSSAETIPYRNQQLCVDADTEGTQWLDCNSFEGFDTSQIGLLSPSLLNQWQQDFYEPFANLNPWLTSSQVFLPALRRMICFI